MKKYALALSTLLLLKSACWAETSVYSNIAATMDVSYSLPNGTKQTFQMKPGWGGALSQGQSSDLPAAVQNLDVTLPDDLGDPVWSGKIRNWHCMFLFKTGEGKAQCGQAGWCMDPAGKKPQAARLFNITGEPLQFNLVGGGGINSCPVSLKPVLDSEQVTRLPEAEENYFPQFADYRTDNPINPAGTK